MVGPLERQPGDDEATGGEKGNAQCRQSPENWTPAYGRIQNPLLAPVHPQSSTHISQSHTHTAEKLGLGQSRSSGTLSVTHLANAYGAPTPCQAVWTLALVT